MIRTQTFSLQNGRVDLTRLKGDSAILGRQVNNILDRQDTLTPSETVDIAATPGGFLALEKDGEHHAIYDRRTPEKMVHGEVWHMDALDLKTAEIPEEARDRNYTTRYTLIPDNKLGILNVERADEVHFLS